MSEEKERTICESCKRTYPLTEENRIWIGNEAFPKCPHCGLTNVGVRIKKENKIPSDKEYDVDEIEWLKKHPEAEAQEITIKGNENK